jgi:hypothetical protein
VIEARAFLDRLNVPVDRRARILARWQRVSVIASGIEEIVPPIGLFSTDWRPAFGLVTDLLQRLCDREDADLEDCLLAVLILRNNRPRFDRLYRHFESAARREFPVEFEMTEVRDFLYRVARAGLSPGTAFAREEPPAGDGRPVIQAAVLPTVIR